MAEPQSATTLEADFDAIVIGAGFGGLYMTYKLRDELGMNVRSYDNGSDIGGTWFWNRYPGALSDTESFVYCFSFDKELLKDWTWKSRYVGQPEILSYLEHFADKYKLRDSYQFETQVTSAVYDETSKLWTVKTNKGDTVTAQHVVSGLGLLSATNIPKFKNQDVFEGEVVHTGHWPQGGIDFAGKRVGVIGTGSTGTQFITATAPVAGHLTVFMRSPQYTVPVRNRPLTGDESDKIKANYDGMWDQVMGSGVAFGFEESMIPAAGLPVEETDKVFEAAWENGGGFRFMFETYCDIATDPDANEAAAAFIRKKIAETVKDPETARKLTPTDLYAKRPLCDGGFYETFNRDNVTLVAIKEEPIVEFTKKGILTSQGEYKLDYLIYATGFDAVDGNYVRMDIQGKNGLSMKDKWKDGPTSYVGIHNAGFPNWHMILGPNGPFTNLPPSIETQVDWIAELIGGMRKNDQKEIDLTQGAEDAWTELCQTIADMTLFPKAESWIFGANIPGKTKSVMFYLGGLGNYRQVLSDEVASGYRSYAFDGVVQPEEEAESAQEMGAEPSGFWAKLKGLFGG